MIKMGYLQSKASLKFRILKEINKLWMYTDGLLKPTLAGEDGIIYQDHEFVSPLHELAQIFDSPDPLACFLCQLR